MKILVSFVVIFALCGYGFSQKRKPKTVDVKPKKTIEIIKADIQTAKKSVDFWANYDKFDNKSIILVKIDSTLSVFCRFETDVLTKTANSFIVQAVTNDKKDRFSEYNRLQFILDDQRLEFLKGRYSFSVSESANTIKELLLFEITRQDIEKIIAAQKVEYRVGLWESLLTTSEKDKLRTLLSLSTAY